MKLWFIYAFLHLMQKALIHGTNCRHQHLSPDEVIHGSYIEPAHVMKKRSLDQKLRIKLFYGPSVYELDQEKFDLIHNNIFPQAVQYWEKALRVRKTQGVIKLHRKCEKNQVFFRKGVPYPYCRNSCESETKCGEIVIPEEHLDVCRVCDSFGENCQVMPHADKPGVERGIKDADFVFYVTALESERCRKGMTVAYAAHCQQEGSLDRPIAGHANLCPSGISTRPQELRGILSTVKHELLHALGFSVSLYAYFRDKDGEPLTPRAENGRPITNNLIQAGEWSDKIIQKVTRKSWKVAGGLISREVSMIVTPRVKEEVRRHFNCSLLEGAELENQGHDGTAVTHWEKRVFENEAMTGTHTQNAVYSRITFALMEDTGWYLPDYSLADDLKWGKGLGCDFAMRSCRDWMDIRQAKNLPINPYCEEVKREPLRTKCTDDHRAVAICNLVQHSGVLPEGYRNFRQLVGVDQNKITHYGGSVVLADYCSYLQEFTWKNNGKEVRGSHCHFPENNPGVEKNFALEKYGNGSRCFPHVDRAWEERSCHKEGRRWGHWGSGCYEYRCAGGFLHIIVDNRTFTCYHAGQELQVHLYSEDWLHYGGIICPDCRSVCQTEDMECIGWKYQVYPEHPWDSLPCGCSYPVSSVMVVLVGGILGRLIL